MNVVYLLNLVFKKIGEYEEEHYEEYISTYPREWERDGECLV